MDGLEALREIRNLEDSLPIPRHYVAAVTANIRAEDRRFDPVPTFSWVCPPRWVLRIFRECMEAGFDYVITKPLKQADVEDVLNLCTQKAVRASGMFSKIPINQRGPRFVSNRWYYFPDPCGSLLKEGSDFNSLPKSDPSAIEVRDLGSFYNWNHSNRIFDISKNQINRKRCAMF